MRKFAATLLSLVLLIQIAPAVSAKPKADWNAVKALMNHSIAVRDKNGQTSFGLLQVADDDGIEVQIAGKEDFTSQQIRLRREEVQKVWRAKLRFGENNIAKGAWIGAGLGFTSTVGTLSIVGRSENADRALVALWFPVLGAGIGAVAGAFWRKKHKKQELIYSL